MNKKSLNLEQKAIKLIEQYKMTEDCDNILVAFSGGSDSSALLFFLIKYISKNNNKIKNKKVKIYAAHVNHMIRGQDAFDDEAFAVETCRKYGVKIFVERHNIPEIAKKTKKTVEEAARDVRYDFFCRIAEELNKNNKNGENTKVVTAHTASDNTETVIFNMARGCGIDGLCGISPVNILNIKQNITVIRPFLSCCKDDIIKYCEENNILYVEDKTNHDDNYTRNYIRHNIAEKLKEKFCKVDDNIYKMTSIMRDNADFIDICADNILKEHYNINGVNSGINIDCLISQHKALRYAVIMKIYEKIAFRKLEYKHILYIDEIINTGNKSKNIKIDLPGLITAEVLYNKFNIFVKTFDKVNEKDSNKNYIKNILPGINTAYDIDNTDDAGIIEIIFFSERTERTECTERVECVESVNNIKCVKINAQSSENIYNLFNYAVIDFDKIEGLIFARNRKAGDEYVFFGQTKNVRKNYINYKVPIEIREILPVFYDDKGIFWACGLPVADRVKAAEDTKNAVSLEVNII